MSGVHEVTASVPVLAIDQASDTVSAALIGPVKDRHRVLAVASGSAEERRPPPGVPVESALQRLELLTGWRLRREVASPPIQLPVAVVSDAADLLPVLFLGPDAEAVKSVVSSVIRLGPVTMASPSAGIGESRASNPIESIVRQIDGLRLALVIAVARDQRDASLLAALVRAADLHPAYSHIDLLFAGPGPIAETFASSLPDSVRFNSVSDVDWLDGSFRADACHTIIAASYAVALANSSNLHTNELPLSWPARGRFEGAAAGARTVSDALSCSVAVLDIGQAHSTYSLVTRPRAEMNESDHAAILSPAFVPAGLRSPLASLFDLGSSIEAITRRLPFDVDQTELADYLANRSLLPDHIPTGDREQLIDLALLQELGRFAVGSPQETPEILIASGGLARLPRLGQVLIGLLDAVLPVAPTRVLLDSACLLPRVALLAKSDADFLDLLRNDLLTDLGPCLSVLGRAAAGSTIGRIEVSATEGVGPGDEYHFAGDIRFGTLLLVPVPPRRKASIRIAWKSKLSFGTSASRTVWASTEPRGATVRTETMSGALGIIIDARGRPLDLQDETSVRQAHLMDWLQAVDALDSEAFSSLD